MDHSGNASQGQHVNLPPRRNRPPPRTASHMPMDPHLVRASTFSATSAAPHAALGRSNTYMAPAYNNPHVASGYPPAVPPLPHHPQQPIYSGPPRSSSNLPERAASLNTRPLSFAPGRRNSPPAGQFPGNPPPNMGGPPMDLNATGSPYHSSSQVHMVNMRHPNNPLPGRHTSLGSANYPYHENAVPFEGSQAPQIRSRPGSVSSIDLDLSNLSMEEERQYGQPYVAPSYVPPYFGNRLVIPARITSVRNVNVDELLDQGSSAFFKNIYDEAILKWRQALDLAVHERDALREAKALSNIGCALRIQGKHAESLANLLRSYTISTSVLFDAHARGGSPWVYLIIHSLELEDDEQAHKNSSSNGPLRRSLSQRSTGSNTSIHSNSPGGSNPSNNDPTMGPPIAVWFMNLLTNMGNVYFSMGNIKEAIKHHDMCVRLCESIFEEFSLPAHFPAPLLRRNDTATARVSKSDSSRSKVQDAKSPRDQQKTKTKLRLSYLHRSTLLSQIRSLTHLGVCYQHMGQDEEALWYQNRSEQMLKYYVSHASATVSSRRSSLSTAAANQINYYEAVVAANQGNAMYTKGMLPASLEKHEHAAKLFHEMKENSGLAKERGNMGCIWIEIGRSMNNLHWMNSLQKSHLDSCLPFWKPPRMSDVSKAGGTDESGIVSAGASFVEKAVLMLDGMLHKSKQCRDWMGVMYSWLNLAVGYTVSLQPYMALHYLSRTIHSVNNIMDNQVNDTGSVAIPPLFKPHVFFVLSQCMYLLTRMQERSGGPLFMQPVDDTHMIDPESINLLLKALDINNVDVTTMSSEDVSHLSGACLEEMEATLRECTRAMKELGKPVSTRQLNSLVEKKMFTMTLLGKISWLMGSLPAESTTDESLEFIGNMWCKEGENWLNSVLELLPLSSVSASSDAGFIEKLTALSEGLMENDSTESTPSSIPHLLSLGSDLLAFTQHIIKSQRAGSVDLLSLLKLNPERVPKAQLDVKRGVLLRSSQLLHQRHLGLCENCIDGGIKYSTGVMDNKPLNEQDDGTASNRGSGLVPLSAAGAGSQFKQDPFAHSVMIFPCAHISNKAN